MIDIYLDESNEALSRDVSYLGRILGEVLHEQGGDALFEAVEGLRRACRHMRHDACEAAQQEIEERVAGISDDMVALVVRAFTVYFHLINMAEENHRLRRLAARESRIYPSPRPDSIAAAVAKLAREGRSAHEVHAILRSLQIRPVFTAHPTEARRMTLLGHLRRISGLVASLGDSAATPSRLHDSTRSLYDEITNLWQTDELRERPQTVLDEVRNGLYYFDTSVFAVAGRLYRDLHDVVRHHYPELSGESYTFLTFGSWMGGDRDGHPHVTPAATEDALRLHKALVLTKYMEATEKLEHRLTASASLVGVSDELVQSLQASSTASDGHNETTQRSNVSEPYRVKLRKMRQRLMATYCANGARWRGTEIETSAADSSDAYTGPQEYLDDLAMIQSSLREHKGQRLADGEVQELVWQVKTFGFHLARLDIRQHRDVHHLVLDELFPGERGTGPFSTWTETERVEALTAALSHDNDLPIVSGLTREAQEVLEVFNVVERLQRELGPEAVDTYIVSFTKGPADVLAVLYLASLCGLFDPTTGESRVRPVPLFETGNDLASAADVMSTLFDNPVFRRHLAVWGNEQEVMIGYSDSDKDAGYVTSNWWLYRAQQELTACAERTGVTLTFFHGRGGAIGRGGGPLHRAIAGQPTGTVRGRLKVTEQGEVLFSRYANPGIAHRHLEQLVNAVIEATAGTGRTNPFPSSWASIMSRLSDVAGNAYHDLVLGEPGFLEFFEEGTPLRSIMRLRIASRPAKRGDGALQLEDLRAIPWVFAWTQSRFGIPGWYGLGKGLETCLGEYGESELRDMYQHWPFFRWLIDAAQISLGKADVHTSHNYAGLVRSEEVRTRVEATVRGEFDRTCQGVNAVVGQARLLDSWPVLQRSIELRNPYVDPMSYLQVRAIRELRRTTDEHRAGYLRAVIERTIAGIAAGLQNTG